MDPGPARAAVERTAQAVMSGNLAQLMSDITPEALAQMMQLAASAGALSPANMPGIEGYEISEAPPDGEAEVFHVSFVSAIGKATLATSWKAIMGQWKVTAVSLVSAEPAPGGPSA
jgi:hypothetical protein